MGISPSTPRRRGPSHYYPPSPHSYPLEYHHSYLVNSSHFHGNSPPSTLYYPYYSPSAAYSCNHPGPVVGQAYFGSFELEPPPLQAAPPCEEQKLAKVVNSDVNVHKDSLRLEIDELNPDHYLVSFIFDALLDGCFTIYYFSKEESDRRVVPLYPEIYAPIKVPFRKGLHQEFRQPPSTGINWHFFASDGLSRSSSRDDVFPIIISAETCSNPYMVDGRNYILANALPKVQITMVVLEEGQGQRFFPRVVRQLLWTDDTCYELREIYGLGKPGPSSDDNDNGKECVICMTEPKCIAVLPCRHMCMCSNCAMELRNQSNKCPICREIIESLLEIKIGDVQL